MASGAREQVALRPEAEVALVTRVQDVVDAFPARCEDVGRDLALQNCMRELHNVFVHLQPSPELMLSIVQFVSEELELHRAPVRLQAAWMVGLARVPQIDTCVTPMQAEMLINTLKDCLTGSAASNVHSRVFAVSCIRFVTRKLNPRSALLVRQLTIVVKNLKATLQDSYRDHLYPLGPLLCTAAIVDISTYWPDILLKDTRQSRDLPFVPLALRVLQSLLSQTPKDNNGAMVRQWAADGLRQILRCSRVWAVLEASVRMDVLRQGLQIVVDYTQASVDPATLTAVLQGSEDEPMQSLLDLPALLSSYLSELLCALRPVPGPDALCLMEPRRAILRLIGKFLASKQVTLNEDRGDKWQLAAILTTGCMSQEHYDTLVDIVKEGFQSYLARNMLGNAYSLETGSARPARTKLNEMTGNRIVPSQRLVFNDGNTSSA